MSIDIARLRHPKEKIYGSLMLIVGTVTWGIALFMILISVKLGYMLEVFVALAYFLGFWGISYIVRALMQAYMLGHYVMVGPAQFPHLHRMVVEGAAAIGLDAPPTAFVYNSDGVMNALAVRLIGRNRYIWLTSALIDADSDDQVRFVIGHELGHHGAGHLDTLPSLLTAFFRKGES